MINETITNYKIAIEDMLLSISHAQGYDSNKANALDEISTKAAELRDRIVRRGNGEGEGE